MNTTLTITAILTILTVTNEVKIGTATIGNNYFDVVKLQVVTNRIITTKAATNYYLVPPADSTILQQESWTNTTEGPIVGTNLVPAAGIKFSTNILWQLSPTNIYINPAYLNAN